MSHESDVDRTVVVSDDDVRVEKSFAREEFPVPAIKFRLVSERDEPVHVRLVDRIPEEFPMEGIGFHPDYESDNWTAYKDHRVEYERTLEPEETTVTVYGIRLEESSDVAGFLGEPVLERPPVPGETPEDRPGAGVDDILGSDRSQLVRDALQGNGRLANPETTPDAADDPGVEPLADADAEGSDPDEEPIAAEPADAAGDSATDAGADDAADEPDAPEPRSVASDLTPAVHEAPDSVAPVDPTADSEADTDDDADSTDEGTEEPDVADKGTEEPDAADEGTQESDVADEGTEEPVAAEAVAGTDADGYVDIGAEGDAAPAGGAAAADGGLAATLAAEIRAGEVSEADLETLRGELDSGLPRSADVRIRRLQSQFADLEAYTDAIEEFIDDEGTGAELVERLDAELEAVTTELEELQDGLDAAAEDRGAIRDGIDDLEGDLAATDERLDDVDEIAVAAADGVDDLHERADAIEGHLDDVESDVGDLVEDIDDVVGDIDDVAADLDDTDDYVSRLDNDLETVRAEVSAVDDDLEEARTSLSADIADLRAEVTALTDELERLDAIESEIADLQTFRDRLNSAFGPGGGGDAGGDGDEE
jgi:predicted  nucleic acid-binding Zn-ribbon protein